MNQASAKDIIEKDIIDLLGGEVLDDGQRAELYKKMLETINLRVLDRIDGMLDDEGAREWQARIETGDSAKVGEYLDSKNINVADLMAEEALRYKSELLAYQNYTQESGKIFDEANEMLKTSIAREGGNQELSGDDVAQPAQKPVNQTDTVQADTGQNNIGEEN